MIITLIGCIAAATRGRGAEGKAMYIDSEGTFRSERLLAVIHILQLFSPRFDVFDCIDKFPGIFRSPIVSNWTKKSCLIMLCTEHRPSERVAYGCCWFDVRLCVFSLISLQIKSNQIKLQDHLIVFFNFFFVFFFGFCSFRLWVRQWFSVCFFFLSSK